MRPGAVRWRRPYRWRWYGAWIVEILTPRHGWVHLGSRHSRRSAIRLAKREQRRWCEMFGWLEPRP